MRPQRKRRMAINVDGYIIHLDKVLGKGRFSRVFEALSPHGEPKAAKIFRSQWVEDAKEELENLILIKSNSTNCPNLVTYDTVLQTDKFKSPIIIMPLLGPSLLKILGWRYDFRDMGQSETTMGLPRWLSAQIIRDSLNGICQLHDVGLIHSDLKPENILIDRPITSAEELMQAPEFNFVVVDVGSSMLMIDAQGNNHGTSGYRAPELVTQQPSFDESIDIAALGAIAFEMRTRDPMYDLHMEGESDMDEDSANSDSNSDESDSDDSLGDVQEDMLAAKRMQELWGRFPQSMVRRSINSSMIFNSRGGILYAGAPRKTSVILERLMGTEYQMPLEEAQLFADFLQSLCALSPGKRVSAASALQHAWLDVDRTVPQ